MSFSPVPDYRLRAVTQLSAEFLAAIGVTLLMLDMDNTIATYGEDVPSGAVVRWADALKSRGVTLYIVSNSRKKGRAARFASALDIGYVGSAGKPSPRAVLDTLTREGVHAQNAALAGDQCYTDVLAANRAGVTSIAVRPISMKNPLLAARYALELPFRLAGGGDKV